MVIMRGYIRGRINRRNYNGPFNWSTDAKGVPHVTGLKPPPSKLSYFDSPYTLKIVSGGTDESEKKRRQTPPVTDVTHLAKHPITKETQWHHFFADEGLRRIQFNISDRRSKATYPPRLTIATRQKERRRRTNWSEYQNDLMTRINTALHGTETSSEIWNTNMARVRELGEKISRAGGVLTDILYRDREQDRNKASEGNYSGRCAIFYVIRSTDGEAHPVHMIFATKSALKYAHALRLQAEKIGHAAKVELIKY